MVHGSPSSVSFETVENLCADGEPESPTLDFKRLAPMKTDEGRTEFLKDVCAFANAEGGDLLYGVSTVNDVASSIVLISAEAPDALKRRLTGYLDAEVQPRVSVEMQEVHAPLDGFVLLVRVHRSFAGPHRFRVHGSHIPDHHRFVARSGTGTIDMDYPQLRAAFDRTSSLLSAGRRFRDQRLKEISTVGTPANVSPWPLVVLHVVPLVGVNEPTLIDVPTFYRSGPGFVMPGGFWPQKATNVDGVLMTSPRNADARVRWYIQVFRSGAMEFACSASSDGGGAAAVGATPYIPAQYISEGLKRSCEQALEVLKWAAITGPAIFGIACFGAAGVPFRIFRNGAAYGQGTASRTNFTLPDVWAEDVGTVADVHQVAKPLLDAFWQCFGEVECEMYGQEWVRPNG